MNKVVNILLVGGGGHCKSCIDILENAGNYNIVGILDLPDKLGDDILGYRVIGNDGDFIKFHNMGYSFLISAGQIKSSETRKKIYTELENIGALLPTVIAKSAKISDYSKIGKGTIIMHNVVVNAGAKIGENCIINTGAIIEHDAQIGSNSHISTGSIINGDVQIGSNCFIGSNSCISNGVKIISNSVVGAASLVREHINECGVFAGIPSRKIK